MRRSLAFVLVGLLVGLTVGFFLGRWWLEREWSQPMQLLHSDSRPPRGDPSPTLGTRGLPPMPLARSRRALASYTARDPLVLRVGAVGRDGPDTELHITFENRGRCTVRSFGGVAYGFDAFGRPSQMNVGGEHFVAFASQSASVSPGAQEAFAYPLHWAEQASLVVAHVDRVECDDGTRWARQ